MSKNNRKLTDFAKESIQQPEDNNSEQNYSIKSNNTSTTNSVGSNEETDGSFLCGSYIETKRNYADKLNKSGWTPPKCGYCIEFLCESVSSGTAPNYASTLRMFISYIHQEDICIEDVTFIDVRNFFESRSEQNLAESTIQSDLSAIEGVINRYEAETDGMPVVSWKISQNIDPKDYSNGTKYDRVALTDEEITSLLKEVDDFRGKLMILVALELGPRSKAICLIEISEIDLEDQIIELRNTKSGGRYEMPLTDNLTSLLKHWINHIRSSYLPNDNNTYLFPSRKGGKLSSQSLLRFVQRAAEKADIQEKIGEISYKNRSKDKMKVDVHALRHTTGRLMKEQGISKDTRRYALDHSRDVTERYGFNKQLHIDRLKHKFDGVDTSDL